MGSKFSEIMVQNRQRQKGIDNYLKSFCESKNDLRNSQASTSWMNLKPSVSQQSCKQTQKGQFSASLKRYLTICYSIQQV